MRVNQLFSSQNSLPGLPSRKSSTTPENLENYSMPQNQELNEGKLVSIGKPLLITPIDVPITSFTFFHSMSMFIEYIPCTF